MKLKISAGVEQIDHIDTAHMMVSLTLNLSFKWNDQRLKFNNLLKGHQNVLSFEASDQIWLPTNDLVIENAVVGQITRERQVARAHPQISEDTDAFLPYEDIVYNGSENVLSETRRIKVTFNCKFDVYQFPFDDQDCGLIFKMNRYKQIKFSFVEDEPVKYGVHQVDQYSIDLMTGKVSNDENDIKYELRIRFKRNPINQIVKVFIPTLLLFGLALSTLFIDMEHFNERFMGAATMILILATWMTYISSDLPKTSYIKLIDVWFVWHISISFAIILCHIVIDKIKLTFLGSSDTEVEAFKQEESDVSRRTSIAGPIANVVQLKLKGVKIGMRSVFSQGGLKTTNTALLIMFTVSSCIFYSIYLLLIHFQ